MEYLRDISEHVHDVTEYLRDGSEHLQRHVGDLGRVQPVHTRQPASHHVCVADGLHLHAPVLSKCKWWLPVSLHGAAIHTPIIGLNII